MICTIEGDQIKCVVDGANVVYKPNTPENRQALGLEDVKTPKPAKMVEDPEE